MKKLIFFYETQEKFNELKKKGISKKEFKELIFKDRLIISNYNDIILNVLEKFYYKYLHKNGQ